ncbi:hypothetical protein [Xylophilus sp.]|uniref:hypothetical protein n=1 Tax=Xylophilus sp. TaxID=2653893 RepID=UPI0013B99E12|nr:hypothetical protein [Xylophilus sp.]KAF1049528.1 MAG: hypothetical protein GAK38_00627 [Xylophilus sp.]
MHHVSFSTALLCAAALLGGTLSAAAQDRIYRCGNEYTNNASQAQARGCKLVEGANVTVVPGTRPSPGDALRAPSTPAAASPLGAPRVDTNDQRARDADARAILEAELRRAEARQAELLKEYNNGEPERQGGERNYQKYLDRVAAMKASIARNESDIAGIRRELERLK